MALANQCPSALAATHWVDAAANARPDSTGHRGSREDGLQWTLQQTLAKGAEEAEFSYPALAWADDALWISYTVGRATLSWQRFAPGGPGTSGGKP